MRGRKRPTTERTKAVSLAVVHGVAEAARQTGIPESTVHQWYHLPEFAELRDRNKEEVTAEWWAGVQKAFRRSVVLLDSTDDPVKAATAGAIMFDKMALSRGEVTSRSESLTSGFDPNQQRRIREWLASLADREGGSGGTGDAVALPSEEGAATA
jgi:hypothetical protein